MSFFTLEIQSAVQSELIENVKSFTGRDDSGSFGILAGHARMIACLNYGLSWFCHQDGTKEYLALPGALLYFINNKLTINTRHYLKSTDYKIMVESLKNELRLEEENLRTMKLSLRRLDEEMLKYLWELKREYG